MSRPDRPVDAVRTFRASPSSVKSYGGCPRKWAARALGGIKVPEGPAQIFGTTLHTMAEKYLLTGEIPDQGTPEGRLFVEGIPHLPRRRLAADEVEGAIGFNFDGVEWIGYYDWIERDVQRIGDHKTSADPRKWGLTAKQLISDVQAATYTWNSGWDVTNLRWLYYAKRGGYAYPVDATLTRSDAEKVLKKYAPLTQEMKRLFDLNPATLSIEQINEIPNKPAECGMVGRNCDFAQSCTLLKPNTLVRKPAMETVDRMAEIRAKIAARKNGETVNPPEAAKAVEETLKEVAGVPEPVAAAVVPEPEPEPVVEEAPKKPRGRPRKETAVEETHVEAPAPTVPATAAPAVAEGPGKVQLDLASLGLIAANLPAGVKLTLTLG